MMKPLNIIFMGTPVFALSPLKALYDAGHNIKAIYCQPPKQKGRGHNVQKNPTHIWGEEHDIPVLTPKSLKTEEALDIAKNFHADIIVVVAYGMLLPKQILDLPHMGCINIHGSLLPRWRGAAPIQRAIMAGDRKTGLTTMYMDEGLDTGDMLETAELLISDTATAQSLHDELGKVSEKLILSTLSGLQLGHIRPKKQPDIGVTYAEKLLKSEGQLDFSKSAKELDCMIRGMTPQVSVWYKKTSVPIKLLSVQPCKNLKCSLLIGEYVVQDHAIYIQCGQGMLKVNTLQTEGKKPLHVKEFLKGYRKE
ncbi:MAG: methionyl-tRNA formyltransferase [Alphaproteobacteria bacterium CG_4_10_14_0_8_um_filter_37_21]|nr:MAG: methionyl-tRNA formyltransferase [Alphaproteobacteria bacterium CG_4_10_14_0_8_um_filter_37_21]